jgi:hypothetical protein
VKGPRSELPPGYELDLLIYNLCDGDLTKKAAVEEMTYEDAIAFMSLGKYQSYLENKWIEESSKKHGR